MWISAIGFDDFLYLPGYLYSKTMWNNEGEE